MFQSDPFWAAIDEQIAQLKTARGADDVVRILAVEHHNSPAFFAVTDATRRA